MKLLQFRKSVTPIHDPEILGMIKAWKLAHCDPRLTFKIAERFFRLYKESQSEIFKYYELSKIYINIGMKQDIDSHPLYRAEYSKLRNGESLAILHAKHRIKEHPIYFDGFDFDSLLIKTGVGYLNKCGWHNIAIDFSNIIYLMDIGISEVVLAAEALKKKNGRLLIFSASPAVNHIIDTIFEGTLKTYEDISSVC